MYILVQYCSCPTPSVSCWLLHLDHVRRTHLCLLFHSHLWGNSVVSVYGQYESQIFALFSLLWNIMGPFVDHDVVETHFGKNQMSCGCMRIRLRCRLVRVKYTRCRVPAHSVQLECGPSIVPTKFEPRWAFTVVRDVYHCANIAPSRVVAVMRTLKTKMFT